MVQIIVETKEQLDVQKLCDAYPDATAIFIKSEGNTALLLRQVFLDRFDRPDDIMVGWEHLCPDWGFPRIIVEQVSPSRFTFEGDYDHGQPLAGWRAVAADEEKTRSQLHDAEKFTRRLKVNVTPVSLATPDPAGGPQPTSPLYVEVFPHSYFLHLHHTQSITAELMAEANKYGVLDRSSKDRMCLRVSRNYDLDEVAEHLKKMFGGKDYE